MTSSYALLSSEKLKNEFPEPTTPTSLFSTSLRKFKPKKKPLPLDQFFAFISRQPPLIKFFAITLASGLPLVIFLVIAFRASSTHETSKEVSEWLAISWATYISIYWIIKGLAFVTDQICSLSRNLLKFRGSVEAVSLRLLAFIGTLISYSTIEPLLHHSLEDSQTHDKIKNLQMAFLIITVAFAVFLVQGILLHIVSIQYVEGWAGPRSQVAIDELETIKELHRLMHPEISQPSSYSMSQVFKRLISPHYNILYEQISTGAGDEDMWTEYAMALWDNMSRGKQSLTRFDIDQQLRNMGRDPDDGQDLFDELDESCDGNVTRDEVEKLVHRLGRQLNLRARAETGIKFVLRRLEIILTFFAVFVIMFLYFAVFASPNAKNVASVFMGFSGLGLSFALGGVVLDFTNQVIFVFAKHPYDVGDFVEMKSKKLIVCKISLTHTDFEEVSKPTERGTVVQMGHSSLIAEPITNWTRTMEAVVAKKKEAAEKEEREEKEQKERETRDKDETRDLILLKTECLRERKKQI